uniref:Uncharacterized protein n=1 Tax=Vespula pensylvanica TaxID=30213 RepID=A0A834NGH7_VESPE|nr:hypothetical protein H0235_014249 [Vespula pensylvanica]
MLDMAKKDVQKLHVSKERYKNKHLKLLKGKLISSFIIKNSIHLWNKITKILTAVNDTTNDWKDFRPLVHRVALRLFLY